MNIIERVRLLAKSDKVEEQELACMLSRSDEYLKAVCELALASLKEVE